MRKKLDDAAFTPPAVQAKVKKDSPRVPLLPGAPPTTLSDEQLEQLLIGWATFDTRRLYDTEGRLLPVSELDDSTARCLAGLKVLEEFDYEDGSKTLVGYSKEVKWEQRIKAVELIMRMRGLDGKRSSGKKDRLDEIIAMMRSGPVKKK